MKAKTEKIKVTVREVKEIEIEISFPYYTRNEGLYCKFFSEDDAIWVYDYGLNRGVKCSNCVPEIWKTNNQITEEEFNAKFNEVMDALKERNNEKAI